jgi:prophage regulatory protein
MQENNTSLCLVRLPQILKVLPVSKSTFWNLIARGDFPKPLKIGRSSFWTDEQLHSYINSKVNRQKCQSLPSAD